MAAMKSYLSVKQVVERLNGAISVKLVYKLIEQGKLRANRATGKVLVEEDSLIELMEGPPKPVVPEMLPPPQRPRGRPRKKTVELW
jgi:excisionase family DNA binding protein